MQPLPPPQPPTESHPAAVPATIGRYQIVERIGAGGMGTVFKAHDPHLNRTVALKVPRIDSALHDRPTRIERFQREARSAAQVWHAHVCPIYDVGEHEGQPYVVMAYVEGQSLSERLAQRGRFSDITDAITLLLQIIDALDAVHRHGIIHRDLKPSNIMLDAGGRAVLMDFGLALIEQESERLTSEGVIVGTAAYMAPEQAAGQFERIGPWTDLYSAGVVFYEMVTGRLPFEGAPIAILTKIQHEPPPPLSSLRPYLDVRLDAILLKALAKEPARRFQSAGEFRNALADLARAPAPTTSFPQAPLARADESELPRLTEAARAKNQRTASEWAFLYPLSACTVLAGVLVVLIYQSINKLTIDIFVWVLFVAGVGVFFGLMYHWWRGQEMTFKSFVGASGKADLYPLSAWTIISSFIVFIYCQSRSLTPAEHIYGLLGVGISSVILVLIRHWWRYRELSSRNTLGETWLMYAARSGQVLKVKDLLTRGAEVNEKDNKGQTALMKAVQEGHRTVVSVLLAWGAEVNEKDEAGWTALMYATDLKEGSSMVSLLQSGAGRVDSVAKGGEGIQSLNGPGT